MSDRGKKKWLPFKALKEQSDYLQKAFDKHRNKDSLIQTPEQIENISSFLSSYQGQITTVEYVKDNEKYLITGIITKIDIDSQCLKINDAIISFTSILSFID